MPALTELLGRRVRDPAGALLGKVQDLAVRLDEPYPRVSALFVRAGKRRLRVPWRLVVSLEPVVVVRPAGYAPPEKDELLLDRDVLDHQVFDVAGKRLARVGDVELAREDDDLRVVAVDVGLGSVLRRLGLRRLARLTGPEAVDWEKLHLVSGRGHGLQLDAPSAAVHRFDREELGHLVAHLPPHRATEVLRRVRLPVSPPPRRRRYRFVRRRAPS